MKRKSKTLEKTIIHPTKTAKKTVKIAEEKNRIEEDSSIIPVMADSPSKVLKALLLNCKRIRLVL